MYIALHGGAGIHTHKYEKEITKALRTACNRALSHHSSALDMVEDAIASLEDNEHFNAGHGSNLTLSGTVECDASLMEARGCAFGSVGALPGVKNPIRLARAVLEHSRIPDELGRIPPMTLVGEGARSFAFSSSHLNNANASSESLVVPPDSLICARATKQWRTWTAVLEGQSSMEDAFQTDESMEMQDTVGAVAWSKNGGFCTGVSSGGLLLKLPGRVGEAAVFGAGCWAQQDSLGVEGMACSVSGAGEYIVRASLARNIGEAFRRANADGTEVDPHDILNRALIDFCRVCQEQGESEPNAGVLLLVIEKNHGEVSARLWCAFTTLSMAIGYASLKNPKPKATILRRPELTHTSTNDEARIFITAISL